MNLIKSLYVKDFRSIGGEINVSLDAPIVLIHGPNGSGKTSLLSAIELALTGAIPSLSRAEPDYKAYLHHVGQPSGEVRLEVEDRSHTGHFTVSQSYVIGTPILDLVEASFFSERSYLAQSTLGRLLEIYQHSEKKSDSPLTRFVKELLGLDRMEAIINGLNSAGHVARLKEPVPSYGIVRNDIGNKERDLDNLKEQKAALAHLIEEEESQLRARLETIDPSLIDNMENLAKLSQELSRDPDETSMTQLIRDRREIEVLESTWAKINAESATDNRESVENANQLARRAFETWMQQNGDRIEALLLRAGTLFAEVPITSESGYIERAKPLDARAQADLERIQGVLGNHERAVQLHMNLSQEIEKARARASQIDHQITAVAETDESFAKALSELSAHISDEVCPVCDRDFSETGATPLASHVATKISTMVEQAGRLQSLIKDRSNTGTEISRLERHVALTTGLLEDAELNQLKIRAAELKDITQKINDSIHAMQEGDQLRGNAAGTARTSVALRNADQSAVALRESLEDIAKKIGMQANSDAPTGELLQDVKSMIQERENDLIERQQARRIAFEAVESLIDTIRRRTSLDAQQRETEESLAVMRKQKEGADAFIEIAKNLVKQTREARGRVVNRVFNDELNAVWRDLFVRLAPEEPFIPAFAIPDISGADIEAVLETHHRRGGKGGNPRAMLSAGNLNTAALTLFLALHFSVKPKLPWLVIDDPVQSMDDVHISQFAALLRTLSKQMNRQVIIAVHERSLFDYLALELSPAFEGDSLNIIELGRSAAGQTTYHWDQKKFVADKAIAA